MNMRWNLRWAGVPVLAPVLVTGCSSSHPDPSVFLVLTAGVAPGRSYTSEHRTTAGATPRDAALALRGLVGMVAA